MTQLLCPFFRGKPTGRLRLRARLREGPCGLDPRSGTRFFTIALIRFIQEQRTEERKWARHISLLSYPFRLPGTGRASLDERSARAKCYVDDSPFLDGDAGRCRR